MWGWGRGDVKAPAYQPVTYRLYQARPWLDWLIVVLICTVRRLTTGCTIDAFFLIFFPPSLATPTSSTSSPPSSLSSLSASLSFFFFFFVTLLCSLNRAPYRNRRGGGTILIMRLFFLLFFFPISLHAWAEVGLWLKQNGARHDGTCPRGDVKVKGACDDD